MISTSWEYRPQGVEVPNSIAQYASDTFFFQIRPARDLFKRHAELTVPIIDRHIGLWDFQDSNSIFIQGGKMINQAIDKHQPILVCLDYDCDGQTAGACMITVLKALGADVNWVVPNRLKEGYGLNIDLIQTKVKPQSLIITVDNGIANREEVDKLHELGHTVLITDHHLQEGDLPKADLIVNPKISMTDKDPEYMAPGVYVGAKTALAAAHLRGLEEPKFYHLWQYCSSLVAMGIVSDVIELNDLLRRQLFLGLTELREIDHAGLNALLYSSSVKPNQPISSTTLAFYVCPKLNAAGRMGKPEDGLNLLLMELDDSANYAKSLQAAQALRQLNVERKKIENNIYLDITTATGSDNYQYSCVVANENWHVGVLGIVASRVAETYDVPTIILSKKDGVWEGSGRSVEGIDLFSVVQQCKDLLIRFGGHSAAIGIAIQPENLEAFKAKFEEVLTPLMTHRTLTYAIDADVSVRELQSPMLQTFFENFEPVGNKNPVLNLCLRSVKVSTVRERNNALELIIRDSEDRSLLVSRYHAPDEWKELSDKWIDILVSPTPSYYTSNTSYEYRIVDIKSLT